MHDLETRQLAWDCALVTGFRDEVNLNRTFAYFAHLLNIQDESFTLAQAFEGLKRVPPCLSPSKNVTTISFVAQHLPGINGKMRRHIFIDQRDIQDVILGLNKSSTDTLEEPFKASKKQPISRVWQHMRHFS